MENTKQSFENEVKLILLIKCVLHSFGPVSVCPPLLRMFVAVLYVSESSRPRLKEWTNTTQQVLLCVSGGGGDGVEGGAAI